MTHAEMFNHPDLLKAGIMWAKLSFIVDQLNDEAHYSDGIDHETLGELLHRMERCAFYRARAGIAIAKALPDAFYPFDWQEWYDTEWAGFKDMDKLYVETDLTEYEERYTGRVEALKKYIPLPLQYFIDDGKDF